MEDYECTDKKLGKKHEHPSIKSGYVWVVKNE